MCEENKGSCCGEGNKMSQCGNGGCGSGHCMHAGMCGSKHFWLLKKVVRIFVLVLVFCFGMQLGELKALVRYTHGGIVNTQGSNYRYGMMGGWYNGVNGEQGSATPIVPVPKQ